MVFPGGFQAWIEKPHQALIDCRFPDHLCAGQTTDASYQCARMGACAVDQLGNSRTAKLAQCRIGREGATSSRPFRVPFNLISRITDMDSVARVVRKSGLMGLGVSHEGVTAIKWRVEPFVTVVGPRIRKLDPAQ